MQIEPNVVLEIVIKNSLFKECVKMGNLYFFNQQLWRDMLLFLFILPNIWQTIGWEKKYYRSRMIFDLIFKHLSFLEKETNSNISLWITRTVFRIFHRYFSLKKTLWNFICYNLIIFPSKKNHVWMLISQKIKA